jgi:methionyl-tRNA synthetase
MKVDLRIAKIVDAGHVEGAEKLIRLSLDIGEAGIKSETAPGLRRHQVGLRSGDS